jgi:hypothetical protein
MAEKSMRRNDAEKQVCLNTSPAFLQEGYTFMLLTFLAEKKWATSSLL